MRDNDGGGGGGASLPSVRDMAVAAAKCRSGGGIDGGGSAAGAASDAASAELFDALLADGPPATEAQALAAFEALLQGMGGEEDLLAPPTEQGLAGSMAEWFADARPAVARLSPAMLRL
eukprot:263729-Chlamydomonas_euryale.AAC.1